MAVVRRKKYSIDAHTKQLTKQLTLPHVASLVSAADLMKVGNTVTIRNGKIDMFKGTMRLAVDKWGLIQAAEAADWEVKVRCVGNTQAVQNLLPSAKVDTPGSQAPPTSLTFQVQAAWF